MFDLLRIWPGFMKNRDLHLDVVRGLAIISVVWGHLKPGLADRIIYVFHMPFFFFISGYFHRVEPDERAYLRRKLLSLMLPYLVYLIILRAGPVASFAADVVADPSWEGVKGLGSFVARLLYGGDGLKGDVGMHWFVSTLFLTQQLFNFLSLRIKSRRTLLLIAAGMYLMASIDQWIPGHVSFPLAANVVLGSFPFYVVGAFYGRALVKGVRWRWVGLAAAIALSASLMVAAGYGLSFRMKLASYGVFILSPLAAFAFTKLLSAGSLAIARSRWMTWALAWVGQASITIMFFHRVVQYNLPGFLQLETLWLRAIVITVFCCVAHWILQQTSLSRALFLGSYRDAERWLQRRKKEPVLTAESVAPSVMPSKVVAPKALTSQVADRERY